MEEIEIKKSDCMSEVLETKIIAKIHNGYKEKFGIPRQSGIAADAESVIVFEKEYRDENALRGIENYSHLWLIWHFSQVEQKKWSPTVRPPRLGGNKRMGVFATRSPYRPNPIGLSSVELIAVEKTAENGTVLRVRGADLLDGTPIFDIKPYLSFTDSHPGAVCGFADGVKDYGLEVSISEDIKSMFSAEEQKTLVSILSQDPRPSYQNEPVRVYGMKFENYEIKFSVEENILSVVSAEKVDLA